MNTEQEYEKLVDFLKTNFPNEWKNEVSAVDIIINLLKPPPSNLKFSAQILYYRGFGPQFFIIPELLALTPEEAYNKATARANLELGEGKWEEVRVRPLNN